MSRTAWSIVLGVVLTLVAGCGTSATSPEASAAGAGPSAAPVETTAASAKPTAAPAGDQTDTDWGRIWDTLPKGFPVYAGATASEETDQGPASAIYVVEGVDPTDVIGWYDTKLEAAGYRTVALDGPSEDRGYTLDTTGTSEECRLEVRAVPMGSGSDFVAIPVMYGAGCPKP